MTIIIILIHAAKFNSLIWILIGIEAFLSHDDINLSWSNRHSMFMSIMESTVSQAVLKPRKNLPWITYSPSLEAQKLAVPFLS